MADSHAWLGGRLALRDPAALTGAAQALYDHARERIVPEAEQAGFTAMLADGRFIGPFNAMFASPDICQAVLTLQKVERERTDLDPRTRQVVILSVGAVVAAPYELYAHRAEALAAGLPRDAVDALAAGEDHPDLTLDERTAQRFTLSLVRERRVADDLFAAARAAFGEKGIVDMVVLIGCYQLVCSLLNALAIPAPDDRETLHGRA